MTSDADYVGDTVTTIVCESPRQAWTKSSTADSLGSSRSKQSINMFHGTDDFATAVSGAYVLCGETDNAKSVERCN